MTEMFVPWECSALKMEILDLTCLDSAAAFICTRVLTSCSCWPAAWMLNNTRDTAQSFRTYLFMSQSHSRKWSFIPAACGVWRLTAAVWKIFLFKLNHWPTLDVWGAGMKIVKKAVVICDQPQHTKSHWALYHFCPVEGDSRGHFIVFYLP